MQTPIHGKRRALRFLVAMATGLSLVASVSAAAESVDQFPQRVSVNKTFDGKPFEYQIVDRTEKPGYVVYRLKYPSPVVTLVVENNTVPAEYFVPEGMKPDDPKRPAVICLHILNGNMDLVRLTCSSLASRGIPAIGFLLPYYGERGAPNESKKARNGDVGLFLSAIDQGLIDIKRTVDLLASRPEVDPSHIGITGVSLGGIVGAAAASIEPRISRAVLVLAGGDVKTIIHHARETRRISEAINSLPAKEKAEVESLIDAADPLSKADQLRARAEQGRVLLVNATEDEVIPPACTKKLAAALGIEDRVVWLNGLGHYSAMLELPQITQLTNDFFAQDLAPSLKATPSGVKPVRRTPLQTVISVVQQAAGFATSEPATGRCRFADLDVSVALRDGKAYSGRLVLARGVGGRFKLQCTLPVVGELAIGQGDCPWMVSKEKTLFTGTIAPGVGPDNPAKYADPDALAKLQTLGAAVAGLSFAPDVIEQVLNITVETSADGHKSLLVSLKKGDSDTLRLTLADDQKTPEKVAFDIRGVQGTVTVRSWQPDAIAPDELFDPPPGLTAKEVDREVLYRIFSAMLNFAAESTR